FAIKASDRVNLYPQSKHPENILPLVHCQTTLISEPHFVLDVHLGRLAAYLRMMGFDTLYRNNYDDPRLANISAQEQRILLTCDRQLLMRKQVSHGYFVRSRQPGQQLLEIMKRFNLHEKQKPFTRCMHCNGKTRPVEKREIEQQLQPKTRRYYHEFYQCTQCKKIYWHGSHYRKMQNLINGIKTQL
ncbi:MAG: Mut7-C RNAse domain-containing protein, partial [Gammaproteobacteria bacterium]|nr:Mut7-C RNAse domain-containing protein [Gammaproteobacteria bacterium]